jgi:hypothetical protein
MASSTRLPLSAEQEAEAQALAPRIRELADEEVVQMARPLVSKPGTTEEANWQTALNEIGSFLESL